MRISDWSSDVCSSDLPDSGCQSVGGGIGDLDCMFRTVIGNQCQHRAEYLLLRNRRARRDLDRKRDVKVKSVSVRDELGGRRNIKKKKHKEPHTTRVPKDTASITAHKRKSRTEK